MKHVIFSDHALKQMQERGASKEEIIQTIHHGERIPAKHGRMSYRHNFQHNGDWGGKFYRVKQVMPIIKEEKSTIVVTVYVFYF